ncbi:TRCF domain-containing protein [uncultured Sphingomonas sp.]|uniref:TRCF domain-containing protein n=1 Tax=uncultured Sphingomonas sp. TaxID=158754 RepID=UPI0035CB6BE1
MPDLLAPAPLAALLATELATRDILYIASDDARAASIAAILAAFAPDVRVFHLPCPDALPGEDAPASPANIGARAAALRGARQARGDGARVAMVTTAEASVLRYAPSDAFEATDPSFAVGDELRLDGFAELAIGIGYTPDDRIDEPGEVAVRGAVVDIFPVDSALPVRIEVEDDRVSAIKRYDPVTQLGGDPLGSVEIGRASEPKAAGGVSLLAHLPDAVVALDPGADRHRARFLALSTDALRRGRRADRLLVGAEDWQAEIGARATVDLNAPEGDAPPRFIEGNNPTRAFDRFAREALADGPLILTGSPRDLRFLAARTKLDLPPIRSWADAVAAPAGTSFCLHAPVDRGFSLAGVTVIAGGDLLGGRARADEHATGGVDPLAAATGELRVGDVIVHEEFGIGSVEGVETLPGESGAEGGDAVVLRYAKDARRLVPVGEADRIWRYGADADQVTLDTLDGGSWQKRRGAIDRAIAESARGLADLAARRDARTTDPIAPDAAAYERFASGFAFTETADQARAIAAVRADLASGKPMDRLVVGDVGYGKTEVALRAAALVALAGRQVAVTAPTTVLVRQHIETFARRFEGTGVEVAGLSRLSTPADKKRVVAGLADGSIKVVIGTGAVAGKGVEYRDLALIVIDEEQRFGVADKAKLAGLGAGHVLSLSATPIPRTLQAAMVGLQSVSVIATPPARRQPIRTAVETWNDATVRATLLREKGRGGQSFVVVPRIEDMPAVADRLAKIAPELKVVTAHGKLPAAEIDEAMVGFAAGIGGHGGDVLLATNIIEAGLDVPRANTMIVTHADRFGLSQLHQLRGRVGRGGRRGQILLLTEEGQTIADATLKRLRTLEAFDRLGAGFAIAARDLDLRGAGDLLGEEQAGHMKLIGIDLYQHLLGHALRAARGQAVDQWTPQLNIGLAGRLPQDWIPEIDVRLSLYGRLARIVDTPTLDSFEAELEDRFGAIPEAAHALLQLTRLRLLARAAEMERIDAGPAAIALTPKGKQSLPEVAGLAEKNGRWLLAERIEDDRARVARVAELLGELVE